MWHLHESIDVIKYDRTCLLNCQCKNKKDFIFARFQGFYSLQIKKHVIEFALQFLHKDILENVNYTHTTLYDKALISRYFLNIWQKVYSIIF